MDEVKQIMHALAYLSVFVAAAVEGETVFVIASVAVATGSLNYWGVLMAGALGASTGDQFFFYAFRGPLRHWVERIPGLRRRRDAIASRVRRHAIALAASCRFLPGLRIAIPVACASAGVSPRVFSPISVASSFVWAAGILALIAAAGPAVLDDLGLARNWALGVSAGVVLLLFVGLRRITLDPSGQKT
jgi:membrane protein DedA with SNARE-associated domain